MREENNYYIWNKGEDEWLGSWFRTSEFSCQCHYNDCVEQRVSKELMNNLDWLRNAGKSPIRINSGFRCAKHQADIEKSGVSTVVAKKSSHEDGLAADIAAPSLRIDELLKLVDMKFNNVGIARNYLHVDIRPLKSDGTKRRWYYY